MKEVIEQYGQTILAVVISLLVLGIFYSVWTNQMKSNLQAYEDMTSSGSGNLGSAISESGGIYHVSVDEEIVEEGMKTDTVYSVDDVFDLKDDAGNEAMTTSGLQIIRVYDLDGNDMTAAFMAQEEDASYFCALEAGAYRVRVRCNESSSGELADAWFYLAVNDAEEESKEESEEEESA